MKLEQYMRSTGAYTRPAWREVTEDGIDNFKGNRAIIVEAIVVSVTIEAGGTYDFQGDETSQNRLARSGWAMEKSQDPANDITPVTSMPWKTADNQVVNITVKDIANILLQCGYAQTAVWF